MKIEFEKYHGAGNDFIMLDSRKNDISGITNSLIASLCDRHFGIGADGLIVLNASAKADFTMDYYNADGQPGSMCGNGGRCTVAFAASCGWITESCVFEASDGLHRAEILNNGRIKLELRKVENVDSWNDESGLSNNGSGNNNQLQGYFLDTGSPHLILFQENVDNLDLKELGPVYRYHKDFPTGTNANFVELHEEGIKVRTYERGVEAETLSCGTGVTAAALAASLHFDEISSPVKVKTLGGELLVEFDSEKLSGSFSRVYLSGPATKVFDGIIKI